MKAKNLSRIFLVVVLVVTQGLSGMNQLKKNESKLSRQAKVALGTIGTLGAIALGAYLVRNLSTNNKKVATSSSVLPIITLPLQKNRQDATRYQPMDTQKADYERATFILKHEGLLRSSEATFIRIKQIVPILEKYGNPEHNEFNIEAYDDQIKTLITKFKAEDESMGIKPVPINWEIPPDIEDIIKTYHPKVVVPGNVP
jgi:hypothetical protein